MKPSGAEASRVKQSRAMQSRAMQSRAEQSRSRQSRAEPSRTEPSSKTFHSFCEKVSQIADTFENLKFRTKKVNQIVETFQKVILKVKKTYEFLKVTCRKCDRGLNFQGSLAAPRQLPGSSPAAPWQILKSSQNCVTVVKNGFAGSCHTNRSPLPKP